MRKIRFIDLFAGIGGFRLALESLGMECVFSSEVNKYCGDTYFANYGELPHGDITLIDERQIPDHDILCAGFPCQPFSISGHKKGFEDIRGTLFFDVVRIVLERKPSVVLLENVKHLKHHDGGRTLRIIIDSLENLGYQVEWKVLNAKDFGVPQNRERIILVGTLNQKFTFEELEFQQEVILRDYLDIDDHVYLDTSEYTLLEDTKRQKSGLIFAGYRNGRIRKAGVRPNTEHLSRVHKQPNRIYSIDGTHPTLPSQESSGRFFILDDIGVRKLTIGECYRIMGFPDEFKRVVSLGEQYKQIGNSVCVPMVREIARAIKKQFFEGGRKTNSMDGDISMAYENQREVLDHFYALSLEDTRDKRNDENCGLSVDLINKVSVIAEKSEKAKGVLAVIVTSLVQKIYDSSQDVRYHQENMKGGYSGRGVDTKFITPFMKDNKFPHMSESGWLTRSLEQNLPYTLDYPGKINPGDVKKSFLDILDFVHEDPAKAGVVLRLLLFKLIKLRDLKSIQLVKPTTLQIADIIEILHRHFFFGYTSRGASRLPSLAIYSAYQCIISEVKRYDGKKLMSLEEHTAADSQSGRVGDIEVQDSDNRVFEGVEIKHNISISPSLIRDAYEKFSIHPVDRYYLLSTANVKEADKEEIEAELNRIKNQHGCQVIVNGVEDTLKYYLRLMQEPSRFVEAYVTNLENDRTLKFEHKFIWNKLIGEL